MAFPPKTQCKVMRKKINAFSYPPPNLGRVRTIQEELIFFSSSSPEGWDRERGEDPSHLHLPSKLVSPSLACIWFSRPWPSDQGLHCISVHADGDKLVLVYRCCCLFGWPCLLVWGSGEKRNLSLDHGGSQAAGGLRLPVTGSLLGDATWNFPLLIHDRDELNKLAFIAQFLGSYTYRVSHPPSFCIGELGHFQVHFLCCKRNSWII